ncbi:LamG-like jellyroll fold domain-containing protein, partial [Reichenbachiella sp.]
YYNFNGDNSNDIAGTPENGIENASVSYTDGLDFTFPTLSIGTIGTMYDGRFDFELMVNKEGTLHIVALDADVTPTSAQIMAGTDGADVPAVAYHSFGVNGYNGVSVTGLAPSTQYWIYTFNEDYLGNHSNVETFTVTTAVEDLINPVLSIDAVSTPFSSRFNFDITVDEEADLSYVVLSSGASAPSSAQILAGTDGVGGGAILQSGFGIGYDGMGGSTTELVTGLSPSTSYDIYVFAQDRSSNVNESSIETFSVTTAAPDGTPPNLSVDGGPTPTAGGFNFDITVDEESDLYYVVLASGSNAPNSTQILAGTDGLDVSAESYSYVTVNSSHTIEIGGLSPVTLYDVYIIAQDYSNNLSGIQNFSVTTANVPNVSFRTVDVPGGNLVAGSSDNHIYTLEIIVSGGSISMEGILLFPVTSDILGDFDQFNYYESTVGDVGYASASLIESRGPVTEAESIMLEGDNSLENNLIVLYNGNYTDQTVYLYITADVLAGATDANTFSILVPGEDSFGINDEYNATDAGLAASNLFTIDNPCVTGDFIGAIDDDVTNAANWCNNIIPNNSNLTSDVNYSANANISESSDMLLNGGNVTIGGGANVYIDLGGNNLNLTSGTFTNDGVVTFSNTTTINNAPNFINNGTIQGGLNFNGNFTNNGIVSPGFSPACMNVGGDYINAGTDLIEIEGLNTTCDAADGFDQIIVTGGNIDISAATLQVTIGAGYTPANGDTFVILNGDGTLAGPYADITGVPTFWHVEYDYPNAEVTVRYDDGTEQNALNFDGIDDRVLLGSDASLQFTTGTLEAWVKTSDAGSSYRSLLVSSGSYGYYIKDNQLMAYEWGGTPQDHIPAGMLGAVDDGLWHHVAMTFAHNVPNGSHLYLDGVEIHEFTYDVGTFVPANGLILGSNVSSEYLIGTMDEVMIWNDIRTPAEIQSDAEFGIASPGSESELVAYYKFNQGLADSDNTTITEAIDEKGINPGVLSGLSQSGTTSNFVSSVVPQTLPVLSGNALNFDGTDHISIPDFGGTDKLTIEMWVNAIDITDGNNDLIRQQGASVSDYDYFMAFQNNGEKLTFRVKNESDVNAEMSITGLDPANYTDGWHHYAGVYNGTDLRLYVDGVLQGTPVAQTGNVRNSGLGNNVLSGYTTNGGTSASEQIEADFDEVMIWYIERTPAQIITDAESGIASPGAETDLQAYYKFDQGIAEGDNTGITSLTDEKGTNDGTFSAGFPTSSGSSSNFISSPVPLTFTPEIEIAEVANGGTFDFGVIDEPGNSGPLTFNINNLSVVNVELTGGPFVQVSGTDASMFSVDLGSTGTPIGSGGSTIFQMTFTPSGGVGLKTATVSIPNNDPDEDPYTFTVEGYSGAPTDLFPGDIAFTMMNSDAGEEFAFMLKTAIDIGTEIHFTDHGMDASGNKVTSEGAITFVATKAIAAGEQIIINPDASNSNANVTAILKSDGSTAGTAWESDASWAITGDPGDQIFAFQGTIPGANLITVDRWLAAINTSPNGWTAAPANNNNSDLPSDLTDGVNALALNLGFGGTISNNYVYDFSTYGATGSLASMVYTLNNPDNWSDNNSLFDVNDLVNYGGNTDNTPEGGSFGGYTSTNVTQSFDDDFFPFADDDVADVLNTLEITSVNFPGIADVYYDANDDGMREVDGSEDLGSGSYPLPLLITRDDLLKEKLKIDITGEAPQSGTMSFTNVSDGEYFDTNTYTFTGIIAENALAFDGDDYVEIQDHTDFELAGPFTIEFLYKSSASGNMVIFEKGTGNDQFSVQQFSGNKIGLNMGGTIQTQGTYNDGNWHHIAIVYRGIGDGTIYVDGEDDTDSPISVASPSYSSANIHIGSRGGTLGFVGQLDELRVWNIERTIGDINTNMVSSIKSASGLVASYDFNHGNPGGDNSMVPAEDRLEDIASNGHSGDLFNFTLNGATSNWVESVLPTCLPVGEFTNSQGNNDWSDPDNWCGGVVPSGSITTDLTITANANVSESANLILDGNEFIVNGGVVFNLDLASNQLQLTNGATFINDGTVYFANGTVLNDVTGTNFVNNGRLGGYFASATNFTNDTGTLAPGFSPACTPITGDFTNGAAATLEIEIDGPTACTGYDQVNATGMAYLDGTLDVIVGYTPTDGQVITFLTAPGGISGGFSTTNIPADWTLNYGATAVTLTYNAEGSALDFDGVDDYFVAAEGGTDLSTSTIEMWVHQTVAAQEWLYWRGNSGTNIGTELYLAADGTLTYGESDGTYESVTSTLSVPAGVWTHVAVVKENNDVIFFINGEAETFTTTFTGTAPSGEFTIGARNRMSGVTDFFTGQIDEVRIWNDKQADASIRTRATQRIASPAVASNLLAYYDLDLAGNASTIPDAATGIDGTNNATLIGKANNTELSNGWVSSSYVDSPQPVMKITEIIIGEDIPSGASSPGSATDGRNFGNVGQPSDTKTKVFEVRNDGVGNLTIANPTLTTGTNYSIINPATTAFLPTESTTFSVVFAPDDVNTFDETINITNNYNTTYTFEVTGEGVDNNALNFGGTDDYVSMGSLGAFPVEGTIELWVNATDLATNKGIFDTDINGNGLRLEVETGLPGLQIVADDDASQVEQLFGSAMSTSTWYHIAITWDTGSSNLVGYVNGVEAFNVSDVVTWPTNLNDFVIGTALDGVSGPTPGRFWNGEMDELRIWNVQRDQTEISANMTNFGVDSETGLLASYDFNVGIAGGNNTGLGEPSLTDITTNTFDGTLTTFAKNGAASNYIASTVNSSAIPEITVSLTGGANVDDDVAAILTNGTDYGYMGLTAITKNFTIKNDGLADLSIATITSGNVDWVISNVSETLPNELAAGAEMTFDLTVTPLTLGIKNAIITIENNDTDVLEQDFEINTTVEVVENALAFDGTTEQVDIQYDNSSNTAYTMEAWINVASLGTNRMIFYMTGDGAEDVGYSQMLRINTTGQLEHYIYDGGKKFHSSNTTLVPGTWYHVAITATNSGTMHLYVDGVEDATPVAVATLSFLTEINLGHGCTGYDPYDTGAIPLSNFSGQMDEFRYWNYARTESQIRNSAGLTLNNEAGLEASYDFNNGGTDAGYSDLLSDITGNDYTGTLEGFGAMDGTEWVPSIALSEAASDISITAVNGDGSSITELTAPAAANGTFFGSTSETRSITQSFTIANEGVTGINGFGYSSDDGDFVISNQDFVEIGAAQTFDVTYNPNGGDGTAIIDITNDTEVDTNEQLFSLNVSATEAADLALDFDGVDDYVTLVPHIDLSAYDELTLESWIKLDGTTGERVIVAQGTGPYNYYLKVNTANFVDFTVEADTYQSLLATFPTDGLWHHLAAIYDGAQLKIYIDGVDTGGSTALSGNVKNTGNFNTGIGANNGALEFFDGQIDEVRIWNVARTVTEVNNNLNASLLGTESGLVAYYSFDNTTVTALGNNSGIGTRNDVSDKTGNYNGTAYNFDMGATPLSYNFRNTSNWVYSGAIASDIFVQDDLVVDLYHGSSHDFGSHGITDPTPLSRTYTITNRGNGTLTLGASAISLSIGSDFSVSAQNGLATLTAGQSTTFTIDFAPSTLGAKSDNINITSDDPDEPTVSIAINGIGVQGPAEVTDGIVSWLRGEDAAADGSAWTDFSGTEQDFSAVVNPTKSSTAIGYQEGLVFTGTEYLQSDNSSILGVNGYTKIAVVVKTDDNVLRNLIGTSAADNHSLFYNNDDPTIYHGVSQSSFGSDVGGQVTIVSALYDLGTTSTSVRVNGVAGTENTSSAALTDAGFLQVGAHQTGAPMDGVVAEVIVYDRELNATELQEVESYLAAKYGISYTQDVVSSGSSTTIWDFSSGFSNDVVTIGRDDASFLDTRQVTSPSSDIQFELGYTTILADNSANVALGATSQFAVDNIFLTMGHDGAAADYASRLSTSMPVGVSERMARFWLVNEPNQGTSDIIDVDLRIDVSNLNDWPGTTAGDYVLMIDNDGADWSDATIISPSDYTGGVITFESVDFDNGQFVTIGHGVDRALDFDGTDDYVALVDFDETETDFTIEAWVNIPNYDDYYPILSKQSGGSNASAEFLLQVQHTTGNVNFFMGDGSVIYNVHGNDNAGDADITVNTWNHIAVTVSGTDMTLFINGVVSGTGTFGGVRITGSASNVNIGHYSNPTLQYWPGLIDEVRIWDGARTAQQIRANALETNAATLISQTNLLVYYDFNRGAIGQDNTGLTTPDQLTDLSGNTNHGTLTSFAKTGTTSNWVLSEYTGSTPATTPNIRVYDADGDLISDNATDSPSATNNTDFGQVLEPDPATAAFVYAIENVGFVPANITSEVGFTGTNNTEYTHSPNVTGTAMAVGSASTDITVTFDPEGTGARTATLSFNTDAVDGTYNFDLTGEGLALGVISDIIAGTTPSAIIDYSDNVNGTVDFDVAGPGVEVAEFTIQDGGGADDGDGLATTLDAVNLTFTNETLISSVALYSTDGLTEYAEVLLSANATPTIAEFTGLNASGIVAPHTGDFTFKVFVSFIGGTVADQTLDIDVTLDNSSAVAEAGGSQFGAFTNPAFTGTENLLDVVADRLIFSDGPSADVATGANFSVTVQAQDGYGNVDTNETTSVIVAETSAIGGTLTGGGATALTSGANSFTLSYDMAGSLNLDAQGSGLTTADYNTDQGGNINIVDIDNSSVIAASGTLDESGVTLDPGTMISEGTAEAVFDFSFTEDNGLGSDNFNTVISQIVFQNGAGITIDENLDDVIAGVALSDNGGKTISTAVPNGATITIGTNTITFANLPTDGSSELGDIADNTTKTYTLSVWFRTDIAANGNSIDQEAFEFEVSDTDFTFAAGSSTLASTQTVNSGNVDINVVSTQMAITSFAGASDAEVSNLDISVGTNVPFTMIVEALDAQGNVDLDKVSTVTASDAGADMGGTLAQPFVAGVATWTDLLYVTSPSGEVVNVSDAGGLPGVATVAFDVSTNTSDIIEDPGFDYPENIDYALYNAGTMDDTGDDELLIAQFILRDGGAGPAMDGEETELTALTFNVTNWENIDELAIIGSGVNEIEVAPTSGTVVMNWGNSNNTDAADGTTEIIQVFATFKQGVGEITDNDQISLTIVAATARGGGRTKFINASAGGASTTLPETDDNRIEVDATQWVQVNTNGYANPLASSTTFERDPGFSIEVEAQDANQNIDLDITGAVDFTFPAGEIISAVDANFTGGTLSAEFVVLDAVFPATTNNLTLDVDPIFPGLSPLVFTDVAVQDTSIPEVNELTGLTPADGELAATAVDELVIVFSENVRAVGGNLILRDFNTLDVVETISVTNVSRTTIVDNVVTFSLTSVLEKGTKFFVTIPSTTFEDFGGNDWDTGLSGAGSWSFTTADATNPIIVDFSPVNNDPGAGSGIIGRSTNIILTFDEPVEFNTGDITIAATGGYVTETYDISGPQSQVTGSGTNVITINPAVSFGSDQLVTISIPESTLRAVDDLSLFEESTIDGVPDNVETLIFRTINTSDNESPGIAGQIEEDFSNMGAGSANLASGVWTDLGASDAAAIDALGGTGSAVIIPNVDGNYLNTPTSFLTSAESFSFQYRAASNASNGAEALIIADPTGAATILGTITTTNIDGYERFIHNFTSPFTGDIRIEFDDANGADENLLVDDFKVGRILSPADGDLSVALETETLTITFDEDIQRGSGTIRFFAKTDPDITVLQFDANSGLLDISSNELTIDISSLGDLPGNVTFYVGMTDGVIEDLVGNPFAGIFDKDTWNFTTESESIPPLATVYEPEQGDLNVPTETPISLTFNEPLLPGQGYVRLYLSSGSELVEEFYVDEFDDANDDLKSDDSDGSLTLNGNKLILNYTGPELSGGVFYYILIEEGAFTDYANNNFAGITQSSDWSFRTDQETTPVPPVLSSIDVPSNGAIDVVLEEEGQVVDLTFTMSEPVSGVSGKNITIVGFERNGGPIAEESQSILTTNISRIQPNGSQVIIRDAALEFDTKYRVEVETDAFKDGSNNPSGAAFGGDAGSDGVADINDWIFTTETDSYDPDVTELYINNVLYTSHTSFDPDNADPITFEIRFNESIQVGTGDISLYFDDGGAGAVQDTYSLAGGIVPGVRYTTTVEPNDGIEFDFDVVSGGNNFFIQIDGEAITDVTSHGTVNKFDGISDDDWTFSTNPESSGPPDTRVAPSLLANQSSPANDDVNVSSATTSIAVKFDEPINTGAVAANRLSVYYYGTAVEVAYVADLSTGTPSETDTKFTYPL